MRKRGIDFYWLAQNEGRVSKGLKDLTNEMFVCRSSRGKTFWASCYEPEDLRKKGKQLYRLKYKFDTIIGGLYDTCEVIVPDEHTIDPRLAKVLREMEAGADEAEVRGPAARPSAKGLPFIKTTGQGISVSGALAGRRANRGWSEPVSRGLG